VKRIAALVLVLSAVMTASASPARAGWCGESSDAACQPEMLYVQCADGTIWLVDPAYTDADSFGGLMCVDGYTVLRPPSDAPADPAQDQPSGPYDLDPNMAPDPAEYVGEVACPDGSIWAVARGDRFTCPP
jgi:hypothetical protein